MHVKIFGMHIVIICNYDTASALMSQASYSDRPILTMVGDLYVALSLTHTLCPTVWGWLWNLADDDHLSLSYVG